MEEKIKDRDIKDLDWQIGDVRTAVAKENRRKGDLVTYAPGGKIVVLHNETGRKISEGDLLEIYIVEEKSRSYHAQVLEITKKYAEIKKVARSKGKDFEKRYKQLLDEETSPATVTETIDSFKEDLTTELGIIKEKIGTMTSKLENINENGAVSMESEEEPEEEIPESFADLAPVNGEAGVRKDKNSYVLVVRDTDMKNLLGEWGEEVLVEIYTNGNRDVQPLRMTKKPWNDGRIRIPTSLRDNFHHLYNDGNDVPVTVKIPQDE